jgi:oxygen-independent coproporphyrinogen-3 oxidase
MYELTIEPNTPFGKMNLEMPDNETMAQMYETIGKKLNLPRYEVSNYGIPCRHNQNIWNAEPYIGLGRGAAGRPLINGVWYEQMGNNEKFEPLDADSRAIEKIIMGLRTTHGVELTPDVRKNINWEFVTQSPELSVIDNRLCAKNFLLLDSVLLDLTI